MPPLRRISSSFGVSGTGVVGLALRHVRAAARDAGSKLNSSPSRASATASGLCTTCSPRLKRVAAEDVAHVVAADDHHLEAGFFGDALEPGRAHLARRSDREPIAGDDERLAAVHARAEVGHQVAERAGLPALVERLEALGHAVGRRRDLIGVDRVELPRLPAGSSDPRRSARGRGCGRAAPADVAAASPALLPVSRGGDRRARLEAGGLDRVHDTSMLTPSYRSGDSVR